MGTCGFADEGCCESPCYAYQNKGEDIADDVVGICRRRLWCV